MAEALLNKRLLDRELETFQTPDAERQEQCRKIIARWQVALNEGGLQETKEKSLQGEFLMDFFRDLLGYKSITGPANGVYSFEQHPGTEFDRNEPDARLGFFGKMNVTRVVVELKDATTNLDKKQASCESKLTPVEQAFGYVSGYDRCDWIIVSNFKELRLYHKSRGRGFYEKFDVLELGKPEEFRKFYFCLCPHNLNNNDQNAPMDLLVKNTSAGEKAITEKFYKDYKNVRMELLDHLKTNNPNIDQMVLIEKTQKILDRFIFIMFCQCTSGLLPPSIVQTIYDLGFKSRERSDQRVWREFKSLFRDIDEGRYDIDPPINAYNGGLFRADEVLECLVIKDDVWEVGNDTQKAYSNLLEHKSGVWKNLIALSDYDFDSELNVNILGRIFEQSISDLEALRAEAQGAGPEKPKSKRKKQGIFYTPEFITRYIVERAIGKYLEENPGGLGSLAVLDPACGSGAFLNQALEFLRQQHRIASDEGRTKSEEGHFGELYSYDPTETDKTILLKNLYGVDLNEESVEITKLALWLKTAKRHQKLENLDENIRCGDSLIDDPKIAGECAFNWDSEFAAVMGGGGFDVVIGNPPYVNIDEFGHGSPMFGHFKTRYSDVYMDKSDLLFYFIKKSIDLLKDNGVMGFIVSNAFLFSDKAKKLRSHILDKCSVLEIVNFEKYYVFKDAGITTCILILQKNKTATATMAYSFKDEQYTEAEILETISDKSSFVEAKLSKDAPFALVGDAVARLNEKIDGRHKRLGEVLHVGQGMETAADGVFLFNSHPSQFPAEFIKKRVSGKNIDRYYIEDDCDYVLYFEDVENFEELPEPIQLHLEANKQVLSNRADKKRRAKSKWWNYTFPMHKEHYHMPKLICSRRAHNNAFVLDNVFDYLPFSNMTVLFCTNEAYRPEYLLALLNSKLLDFRYKSMGKQTGGGSFEYFPNGVSKLPIADASPQQQQSLADKALGMIQLNSELDKMDQSAASIVKARFGLTKASPRLDKLHLLGEAELLKELGNAKAKISMKQQQELLDWFRGEQSSMRAIDAQIAALDRAIDDEVYGLYSVTDKEIELIEAGL